MSANVPMVLIDNVFALNMCRFRTTLTIGLDMKTIIPSPLTIRAYDNTLRKVMETFKSPCKIGPLETIMEFHLMHITPNYNLILGRAWLHPIGAISSTLHQKMKILWKWGDCCSAWWWRDPSSHLWTWGGRKWASNEWLWVCEHGWLWIEEWKVYYKFAPIL